MREIKFRGLSFDGKWLFGDLVNQTIDAHSKIIDVGIKEYGNYPVEVRKKTIGQFTGLKDKNGKEIYEGDFVLISDNHGDTALYEIKYREDLYMFVGDGNGEWLCLEEFEGCEIVGNVHEYGKLFNK